MSALTLQQLRDRLALYLEAEARVLRKQEYTVGVGGDARRLTFADLAEIRAEIRTLSAEITTRAALEAPAGSRPRRVLFIR